MSDGYGNVYIFNIYSENIAKFNLNDQGSAGTIVAPSKTATKSPYQPQCISVSRTALPKANITSPLFVQGNNEFTVDYLGQNWTGTANIDPTIWPALNTDLWLYVFFQMAWLLDPMGHLQTIYSTETRIMEMGREVVTFNYQPSSEILASDSE